MAESKDIMFDETGDLLIQNGDFVIGESDFQHIQDILKAAKGWFKNAPWLGANAQSQLHSNMQQAFLQAARINLEADGYKVKSIGFDKDGNLKVEAKR